MLEQLKNILSNRTRKVITEKGLRSSAVLVPFFMKGETPFLLLVKRSQKVAHHRGEVSFPGGAWQEGEESLESTALREVREEVGIQPRDVKIVGVLDDVQTVSTRFCVTPVVGIIPYPYHLLLDEREVDEVIEIPLAHLLDEKNNGEELIEREGKVYLGPVYRYQHYVIWGATAKILKDFLKLWVSIKGPREEGNFQ